MSTPNTPTESQLAKTWSDHAPENTVLCSRCPADSEPIDREVLAPPHVSAGDCDVHGWFQIILFDGEETQHFKDDTLTLGEVEDIAAEELSTKEKDAAKQAAYDEANRSARGESHRTVLRKHLLKAIYAHRASIEPEMSDGMSADEKDEIAQASAENAAEDAYETAQDTQAA